MKNKNIFKYLTTFLLLGFSLCACGGGGNTPTPVVDDVKVTLSQEKCITDIGSKLILTASFSPAQAADSYICVWKTSNSAVATVTKDTTIWEKATVKAIADGSADITCTLCRKVNFEELGVGTCKLTVGSVDIKFDVTSLTIDLSKSTTGKINATVRSGLTATWSSSDNSVASVSDDGTVTAYKEGSVVISATAGNQKAECTVYVVADAGTELLPNGRHPTCLANPGVWYYIADKLSDGTLATCDPTPRITSAGIITANVNHAGGGAASSGHIFLRYGIADYEHQYTAKIEINVPTASGQKIEINPNDNPDDMHTFTMDTTSYVFDQPAYLPVNTRSFQIRLCDVSKYTIKVTFTKQEAPVPSLKLDKTSATIDLSQETKTVQLTPTTEHIVSPTFTWESSDTKVATVDNNGLVTGVAAGKATITCHCGELTADCEITVIAETTTELLSGGKHDVCLANPGVWYYVTDKLEDQTSAKFNPVPTISSSGIIKANLTKAGGASASSGFGYLRYGIADYENQYTAKIEISVPTASGQKIEINPNNNASDMFSFTMTTTTYTYNQPAYTPVNTRSFQIKLFDVSEYTIKVTFAKVTK